METKIGYKVVRVEGDKLVSTWAEYMFKKEYKVGEWTEGLHELLPLVLFDDEDTAFAAFGQGICGENYRCFKCEYLPSGQEVLVFSSVVSRNSTVEKAIKRQDIRKYMYVVNDEPHIVLAKAIKLLEEVTI